jgi:23S rRNA (adenine2503-C2)-methyltransferase
LGEDLNEELSLNIKDLTLDELQDYIQSFHLPKFRAVQIFSWLYQKKVCNWGEMTDLPKSLRQFFVDQGISLGCLTMINQAKADDYTIKFLFELADYQSVESVFLPEPNRNTICFSTQAGCGMGCIFCATGQNGFVRNLTVGEITDQVLSIGRITGANINNLVAMGQGEPLANYDMVMKAIKIFNDPSGLGIGARHITLSTCGIIPKIYQLAREPFQVNLAISLHSADNELRNQLVPINRIYPLKELLNACREYTARTGRRVTFEYALIKDVNDRNPDLQKLIEMFNELGERSRALYHLNLIPLNLIPGSQFNRSGVQRTREFAALLNQAHIETTIRKERGSDLSAACGQLQGKRTDRCSPARGELNENRR